MQAGASLWRACLRALRAMDNDQQVQVIQAGLDALEGMPVSDDRSAREAFTHVMVTVSRINELSAKARAQAMIGGGVPGDEITENLREWLDRLVSALPGIVGRLAGATAFSISVGANVAVTVDFSSSAGSSAKDRLRMLAVAGLARRVDGGAGLACRTSGYRCCGVWIACPTCLAPLDARHIGSA